MPGSVFLRGDNVTLNTCSRDDYSFVADVHNDPSNRDQAGISLPVNESDVVERVEDRDEVVVFIVCHEGEPVGITVLSDIDMQAGTAELGYIVHPEEHGEGYGTEAAALCVQHAFDDRDLDKVWAQVIDGNEASRRVLEKVGFQREGRLRDHEFAQGQRVDVFVYGLVASER